MLGSSGCPGPNPFVGRGTDAGENLEKTLPNGALCDIFALLRGARRPEPHHGLAGSKRVVWICYLMLCECPMKLRIALIIVLNATELVWSQTGPARGPEFEVVSVKPTKSEANGRPQLSCRGGRLLASNFPAQFLIEYAYDIRDTFPLPDWARPDGDKYNVEAKADNSITAEACKLMTQRLLEDRFQLKLHKELRETDVYFLTVAKGGTKLKPVVPGSPVTESSGAWWRGQRMASGMRLPALVVSLTDLQDVGRRVVDRTGLPTDVFYEFRLDYPAQEDPDIFEATEAQLGLKLVPGKAPVEFVVVDHINKPSPN